MYIFTVMHHKTVANSIYVQTYLAINLILIVMLGRMFPPLTERAEDDLFLVTWPVSGHLDPGQAIAATIGKPLNPWTFRDIRGRIH